MNAQDNSSSWSEDLHTEPQHPVLDQDLTTDIAIVGGGITGLTAAYLLKKAGKDVVVFERNTVASGTTSYSTGFLVSATEVPFHKLLNHHNFESIKALWDGGFAALQQIEKIINEEKVDCEFWKGPMYYYAKDEQDMELLRKESAELTKAQIDMEISTCENCLGLKTKGFLKLNNQSKFNPTKYVLGLSEALKRLGVQVYENSHVEEVKETSDGVELKVNKFTVKANDVVIATHSPITNPIMIGAAKLIPFLTYVIEARIPKGSIAQGIYEDTEVPYHYLRVDNLPVSNFDRLIFGGADNKLQVKVDAKKKYEELRQELKLLFPELNLEMVRELSGEFYVSGDDFPLIGRTDEHQIVCTGYSGSGLPTGTLAAMIACDLIIGKENPLEKYLKPTRMIISTQIMEQGLESAKHFAKNLFNKVGEKDLNEIEKDSGEVVSINGRKVAVYKDSDGNISKVSAICTHLGCTVGWNNDSKTWDCPCHGSRFSATGNVINGPANKPLENISD